MEKTTAVLNTDQNSNKVQFESMHAVILITPASILVFGKHWMRKIQS